MDTVKMDIPLFIRLLEYAREDAESDIDLHFVAERVLDANIQQGILTMNDYDDIIDARHTLA